MRDGLMIAAAVITLASPVGARAEGQPSGGSFFFPFSEESCVVVGACSPECRKSLIKRSAAEAFREPSSEELAEVGDGYLITAFTRQEMQCRGLRPMELVITDSAKNVRSRFAFDNVSTETMSNAFGAAGEFHSSALVLTRADVVRAFGQDGLVHLVTSEGTKSVQFKTDALAESLNLDAGPEREARIARMSKEAATQALVEGCRYSIPTSVGLIHIHKAAEQLSKLSRAEGSAVVRPYVECIKGYAKHYKTDAAVVTLGSYFGK
jgi:hypothetical protein